MQDVQQQPNGVVRGDVSKTADGRLGGAVCQVCALWAAWSDLRGGLLQVWSEGIR
jgi:hypothetical protein